MTHSDAPVLTWWSTEDMAPGREALRLDGRKVALLERRDDGLLTMYKLTVPGHVGWETDADPERLRQLGAVLVAPVGTRVVCRTDGRVGYKVADVVKAFPVSVCHVQVMVDDVTRVEFAVDVEVVR